jgi:hypothetical protein
MLTRLFITVTAVAVACGSVCAQSLILEKGQSGPFFEAGYVIGNGINGGAFNIGHAFNNNFDLGFSYTYTKISTASWGGYGRAMSMSVDVGGQFANFYPLRPSSRSTTAFLGLHEAYAFFGDASENTLLSGGASFNLFVPTAEDAALVFTAAIRGTGSANLSGDIETGGMFGAILCSKFGGRDTVGLLVQYDLSDASDTFAVGLSYTVGS